MQSGQFHIFVKPGDATRELQKALAELGLGEREAGVHRHLFVTRANQTVVMVTEPNVPIAAALRRRGWSEPGEASS